MDLLPPFCSTEKESVLVEDRFLTVKERVLWSSADISSSKDDGLTSKTELVFEEAELETSDRNPLASVDFIAK